MPNLNDVQSKLNETFVSAILTPSTFDEISRIIVDATTASRLVCPAGALHSMGGQQFVANGISISSDALRGIGSLDREARVIAVETGVRWPQLIDFLKGIQESDDAKLTIVQKQTGADDLTIGGAISSNIHGRVLGRQPIVADIAGFNITTPEGVRLHCSRQENEDLFGLVIGGYGLFGFIDSVELRLTENLKLRRHVAERSLEEVIPALEAYTEAGAQFGDFQYMTDESSSDFLRKGILSVYSPVAADEPIPFDQQFLSLEAWKKLFVLAHTDKRRAYEEYVGHYLTTDQQLYWSDEHQLSPYLPGAGDMLFQQMGWQNYASLMITELYVPRGRFVEFMGKTRRALLLEKANVIYGTVRLIEPEHETYLNWARESYACVIFNLLVEHSPVGIESAQRQFQKLIDCALEENGSFYLTYHKWARKDQIETAYPQFESFLAKKEAYDPHNTFSSEWYRHHVDLFS
tara:strand:+ start:504 stop:1892 length:1389 start_codon:yes stop_codon:yes gene_type:complete